MAGHRAAASVAGGADGTAWLGGAAAQAVACDACLVPVVTGDVDPGVLDRLAGWCVELVGHGHGRCQPATPGTAPGTAAPGTGTSGSQIPASGTPDSQTPECGTCGSENPGPQTPGCATPECRTPGGPLTGHAREMLQRAIIGAAASLLSGPGGLASWLRRSELGGRLAGPSLPLDVGYSQTVPAGIRHAVTVRARGHCEWPGGCFL